MAVLEAEGVEGASLLGFLAAVGALRLLDEKYPGARLSFGGDSCHARFDVLQAEQPNRIIEAIIERWSVAEREQELALLGAAEYPKEMNCEQLEDLAGTLRRHRSHAAFLVGLVCDQDLRKEEIAAEAAATTLCAANGASKQKMFTTMRDLRNVCVESELATTNTKRPKLVHGEHLRKALLGPWMFQDSVPDDLRKKHAEKPENGWMGERKPTLRWDEGAERLHALRFADPTKDTEPFRTELGAYALAVNALACLPVVPHRRGPLTVSSDHLPRTGAVDFYWPLWDVPLTIHAVKMLLWSAEAKHDPLSAQRRGVFRCMRAQRLTQEKGKLTFLPAVPVW